MSASVRLTEGQIRRRIVVAARVKKDNARRQPVSGAVTYPCGSSKVFRDHPRHSTKKQALDCDVSAVSRLVSENAKLKADQETLLKALEFVIDCHNSQIAIDAVHAVTGKYADRVLPKEVKP